MEDRLKNDPDGTLKPAKPGVLYPFDLFSDVLIDSHLILSVSGTAGAFKIWPSNSTNGTPLLVAGQTITNDVSVVGGQTVNFATHGQTSQVWVEFCSNGAGSISYSFAGKGSAAGIDFKDTLDITAYGITIEVNDTATIDDDVVCRYSENPAERPTISCRIKVESIPRDALTVTLTGSKLRFPNKNDISKELSLPSSGAWMPFTISGQIPSTIMNDAPIQVRLGGVKGNIIAEKDVTVLWVDISMRNTQDAGFSSDNNSELKPIPSLLGKQLLNMLMLNNTDGLPPQIAHVVEFRGNVYPTDFLAPINCPRDYTGTFVAYQLLPSQPDVEINETNVPRGEIGIGNDPNIPQFQDLLPIPNGRIYDIDIPGHWTGIHDPARNNPQNTTIFIRYNFLQYASFKGMRCSDDFAWFVRFTSQKISPPGMGDYIFYNRPGHNDNQSGTGTTSLSVD